MSILIFSPVANFGQQSIPMLLCFSIDLFLFFVEKGKYYIDFKNGSGQVGEGDPASKADVTITMNEEIFLKIFNRKLTFIIRSK